MESRKKLIDTFAKIFRSCAKNQSQIMKLLATTAAAIILSLSQSFGQGAYFNAGFGYGLPVGDLLQVEAPDGVQKSVYGSYGTGLTVGLGTGYMVNSNVGFDLGIWYLMGSSYEFESVDTAKVTDRVNGKTVRIIPS